MKKGFWEVKTLSSTRPYPSVYKLKLYNTIIDSWIKHRIEATSTDFSMPRPRVMEKTTSISRSPPEWGGSMPSMRMKESDIATFNHVNCGSSWFGISGWRTTWSIDRQLHQSSPRCGRVDPAHSDHSNSDDVTTLQRLNIEITRTAMTVID